MDPERAIGLMLLLPGRWKVEILAFANMVAKGFYRAETLCLRAEPGPCNFNQTV
jgi:hypothetical protein